MFEILSQEDIPVPRHGIHDRDCDPDGMYGTWEVQVQIIVVEEELKDGGIRTKSLTFKNYFPSYHAAYIL